MSDKCSKCCGTGIEHVKVEMPDGHGGYDVIEEPRPCRECQ